MKPSVEQIVDGALDAIELEFRRGGVDNVEDVMEEPAVRRAAWHVAGDAISEAWNEFRFLDDAARMLDLGRQIRILARAFVKQTIASGEVA